MKDEDKTLEQLEQEIVAETNQAQSTPPSDGTESTNTADSSVTPEVPVVEDPAALKAELETLRKESAKVEMERNLLRNKQKEAERKALDSVDKTKLDELNAAYESLLAKNDERDAEEAEKASAQEANDFRTSIIAQRSEKVQAAAKALIAKNPSNIAWSDAKDAADAEAQLNSQLDALQEILGTDPVAEPEANPTVHPNNPGNPPADKPFEDMTFEEMDKFLPHAPDR